MSWLIRGCLASLLLYALAFGLLLDRPLAFGFLRAQIDAKLEHAATINEPKLVILAGSNGPYSHRCQIIEPLIHMPCLNGGVAVGVGLDYLFARWKHYLHRGDLVYLPMEEAQYVRTQAATDVGPDAAIMFRHDWRTLAALSPDRWLAGLFAFDLRFALMAPTEASLQLAHFHDPRPRGHRHDECLGRSCRSYRRTRDAEPGNGGLASSRSRLSRAGQLWLWHIADCLVHSLGQRTWCTRHRRAAH